MSPRRTQTPGIHTSPAVGFSSQAQRSVLGNEQVRGSIITTRPRALCNYHLKGAVKLTRISQKPVTRAQPASRLSHVTFVVATRRLSLSRGHGATCATSASDRRDHGRTSHIDRGASHGRGNASRPDLRNSGNAVGRTPP